MNFIARWAVCQDRKGEPLNIIARLAVGALWVYMLGSGLLMRLFALTMGFVAIVVLYGIVWRWICSTHERTDK
jgi:hypothetical protein